MAGGIGGLDDFQLDTTLPLRTSSGLWICMAAPATRTCWKSTRDRFYSGSRFFSAFNSGPTLRRL